jgi:hypothetical protein
MGCGCDSDKECQDLEYWSSSSFTLDDLNKKLGEHLKDDVYVYTVSSTKLSKDTIKHIGSGPNLEGELATLCTCKHWMRQQSSLNTWKNTWILGLTSRARNNGFNSEHFFFYLMKVEQEFKSHQELFKYLSEKNSNALKIKNAVTNRLGDIFEPDLESSCTDPFKPDRYKKLHPKHSHVGDQWHGDITGNGKDKDNNSARLLLGDVKHTFVWTKPCITFSENRNCGSKKMKIEKLLKDFSLACDKA